MKVFINYVYGYIPYTTAYYIERAFARVKGVEVCRLGENDPGKVDLIVNIMPMKALITSPGIPSCYWEIDCHVVQGRNKEIYEATDRVYIAQKEFLDYYPAKKTSYLPLACDPQLFHRFYEEPQKYDIGFIGNTNYPERRTLLQQLGTRFELLSAESKPGAPYSRLISSCKMGFNRSLFRDLNMRFFEVMSCGRLLLTDYLPAQDDIAKIGVHYDIYKDWRDLEAKVKFYLTHEKERERIASQGSLWIKTHHTYEHRVLKILADFGYNPKYE
jgi:spore maturation protein CgeB